MQAIKADYTRIHKVIKKTTKSHLNVFDTERTRKMEDKNEKKEVDEAKGEKKIEKLASIGLLV